MANTKVALILFEDLAFREGFILLLLISTSVSIGSLLNQSEREQENGETVEN